MSLISKEKNTKDIRLSPVQVIPASFLIAILAGTLLLMLPVSSSAGRSTDPVTALFTATTSICVTGLVVVDTYSYWSLFGQVVIALLIQIGGLGMIAIASTIMLLTRRKFSLTDRILLRDAFNLNTSNKLLGFLVKVIKGTFAVEAVGAVLYSFVFIPRYGMAKGLWSAVFNSVSAFCNAGMDVLGSNSLENYQGDPLVLSVTSILIILGGIGFVVWFDVAERAKEGLKKRFSPATVAKRLSEHSKLALGFTLMLLLGGTLIFLLLEYDNPGTIGGLGFGEKIANSFFESVTLRTAGFSTFPQENLTLGSCVAAYILMFIGGSPIGTAGGIKTTTFFLLILNVRSYLRNQDERVFFGRSISEGSMRKASAIAFISGLAVLFLTGVLSAVNPVHLEDALFEVVSACGTVGLSRGLTSSLSIPGRLTIITAMYLGRIGPISLVALFTKNSRRSDSIRYSEGNFYVG
ncbi:MAG: potassium transporter TrkH [Lachnospiraceae bacterium]|nr:potassium transporter TrkH [Lachnospiraceae bacterium]